MRTEQTKNKTIPPTKTWKTATFKEISLKETKKKYNQGDKKITRESNNSEIQEKEKIWKII